MRSRKGTSLSLPVDQDTQPKITLDSIDAGVPLAEGKTAPDAYDLLENERLQKIRLENKHSKARLKDVKADRALRKTYANRILRFLEVYAALVGLMVIADGAHFFGFHLEKEVTATLVGSTAVAAIGLVGFIARGLFKPPSPPA
jgi:hypothetical protein